MKLEFKTPELSDAEWAVPHILNANITACDYNFANIFLWRDVYRHKICFTGGMLLVKTDGVLGEAFLFPIGNGDLEHALKVMKSQRHNLDTKLTLVCVTEENKIRLDEIFPGRFEFIENIDYQDYVYSADKLAELAGKKLHSKRNHINKFIEGCSSWSFEKLCDENTSECRDLMSRWMQEKIDDGSSRKFLSDEMPVVMNILNYRRELNICGGVLRVNGEVTAFSAGCLLNGTCFDVIAEKADRHIPGCYAVINREMSKMVRDMYPDVKWINREDDMGLEGLRKSKQSYFPDIMIKKYTAIEK